MIRRLLSAIVGLIAVYIVLTFVYSQFPETRAAMGNMKEFVGYAYDWSVAQWGTTAVGGAFVLVLMVAVLKR